MTSKASENICPKYMGKRKMKIIGYVGRYDNATGYMAWAHSIPVDTIQAAKLQVGTYTAYDVDVIEVTKVPVIGTNGQWVEGETVATKAVDQGWILRE